MRTINAMKADLTTQIWAHTLNYHAGTGLIASSFVPRIDSPESSPKAKNHEALELDEDLLIILQSGLLTRHRCALHQQLVQTSAEANGPVSPQKPQK